MIQTLLKFLLVKKIKRMQAIPLDEVQGREVSTQDRLSMKHFARKHVK